ncbi:MAG: DUF262 domain-containing protein [Spirochaetes bacterium]|nr:DUF262 domain-containing protein [Spirochaetota bacterium]
MDKTSITIKKLVSNEGLNYDIFLPAIQRPFVWLDRPSEKRIEKFFDSLLRGYPIGSFLLWRVNKEKIKEMEIESFSCNYNDNQKYNKKTHRSLVMIQII